MHAPIPPEYANWGTRLACSLRNSAENFVFKGKVSQFVDTLGLAPTPARPLLFEPLNWESAALRNRIQ
jgi:hypothetical protein